MSSAEDGSRNEQFQSRAIRHDCQRGARSGGSMRAFSLPLEGFRSGRRKALMLFILQRRFNTARCVMPTIVQ